MSGKILIVEDEELNLEIMKDIFKSFFEYVYTASNGERGIDLFKEKAPDVIITDIKMDKMDGLTMINKILMIKKDQPFVIVSAHSDVEYVNKAKQLGVNNFLVKPVNCKKLLQITRDIIKYA